MGMNTENVITEDDDVLEVLNEGRIIFKNSLSNCKGRSKYWGARYWASCKRCNHWWNEVIDAGWGQRLWSPGKKGLASPFQRAPGGLPLA